MENTDTSVRPVRAELDRPAANTVQGINAISIMKTRHIHVKLALFI
jgi:hypothetical protein